MRWRGRGGIVAALDMLEPPQLYAFGEVTSEVIFKPEKRGRGRPKSGNAMTNAEKQRAYRERVKAKR